MISRIGRSPRLHPVDETVRRTKISDPMPALGQKQTSAHVRAMSALPPKADIDQDGCNVRFVPEADILRRNKERRYSITSSAR